MNTPPIQAAPVSPLRQQLIDSLTLKGYSPRTIESYVYAVAGLSKFHHRSPSQLGPPEIHEYLLSLHRGGRHSASTINVIINGLRYFYREILGQPLGHVERTLPRARRTTRRPQVYSVAQVERLLERGFLCPKHRVLCMTLYGAGLRLSEALHLRTEHLDPARGLIRVEQGKGRKDRYTLLPQRLLFELRAYWKAFRPEPWLFPSRQNATQPVGAESVRKTFSRALQRAGLPVKGGPHCLRHSFATHLLEAGTPLHVVKRFLGHNSLYTTAGYLHITPATLQAVTSPLEGMFALDPAQP